MWFLALLRNWATTELLYCLWQEPMKFLLQSGSVPSPVENHVTFLYGELVNWGNTESVKNDKCGDAGVWQDLETENKRWHSRYTQQTGSSFSPLCKRPFGCSSFVFQWIVPGTKCQELFSAKMAQKCNRLSSLYSPGNSCTSDIQHYKTAVFWFWSTLQERTFLA